MTDNIDYEGLKKRGFLRQRQEGYFVLRTRMGVGVYTNEQLDLMSAISKKYGRGFVHATTRQGIEIPFIKYEDIECIEREMASLKINIGVSGPRLRTITACPGINWCRFGFIDTFGLAQRIEKELGAKFTEELPYKFKIAISGCPNGCTRPQASEIGIHGAAGGYAVYLGGCGGRTPRAGFKLDKVFNEDEVLSLIVRVVAFFKNNAKPRQRLAALIEERGSSVKFY
jgi:dissimilatory sulfite reductase (desulfoviridin) alpha/beta subunit